MQLITLYALKGDEKMHRFLRENSEWYKSLNRNASNYQIFVKEMKKKYKLNPTDKISGALDNLDLITSVIQTVKQSVTVSNSVAFPQSQCYTRSTKIE